MGLTSTGSNPVFPIMYTNSFINTLNIVNINYNAKKLSFLYKYTKKNLIILKFFKKNKIIDDFTILKKKNKLVFFIKLLYYKNLKIIKNFKLYTKKSHYFFISLKALKLLNKRSGSSLFVISSSFGYLTHLEAISLNKSGFLVASFFN